MSIHGSRASLAELLAACQKAGARPAEPGEFEGNKYYEEPEEASVIGMVGDYLAFGETKGDFEEMVEAFEGEGLNESPKFKEAIEGAPDEGLGHVYVDQYFAGDSKEKTLVMVHDIENAMDADIDKLDWMSPETRVKAKAKLHLIANKIGYPENWRDYSKLDVAPADALGNAERSAAFENDRQLNKIGKPVDKQEWGMTPPTVNAYYDPSMNNINFPAGILEPAFYDPHADIATNYGHMGAIIGHAGRRC